MEWLQEDLTRESKYILKLRYGHDLEFRAIGVLVDRTENSVIQMHKRILDYLRDRLAQRSVRKLSDIL